MAAQWLGRKGRPWLRTRQRVFAEFGTVCWICGHDGAGDIDHLVARSKGGHPTDPTNLRPAHGAKSRCPVCGRACNQVRGTGTRTPPRMANTSRAW